MKEEDCDLVGVAGIIALPSSIAAITELTCRVTAPDSIVLSVKLTFHMQVLSSSFVIASGIT
jgi:hypothetical protein